MKKSGDRVIRRSGEQEIGPLAHEGVRCLPAVIAATFFVHQITR
jgi:hypothetical protein